jgi:hypothetical protein
MKRAAPPTMAAWLLRRFVVDEALVGDLAEELRTGRSRVWYWRQALAAVTMASVKEVGQQKLHALQAVVTGWVFLLLIFIFLGPRVANGLAFQTWGWTREIGYDPTHDWQPFHIAATFDSYAGFAISAWAVVRSQRDHALPMLLAYLVSVVVVLTSAATFLAWRARPIAVPHPLFYVVSPTLPYVWRAGLLLVPLVILIVGLWTDGHTNRQRGF